MRVDSLSSGDEVVLTLQEAQETGNPFDLCIIDIQMPGMSGYEVTKQIRNPNRQLPYLPLLALSSSMERDAKTCEEAGFDGFLNKPVSRKKLRQMLERLIGEKEETKEFRPPIITGHSVCEKMKQSVRILLAEDNPVNRKLAKMLLTKAGYQVEVADNGREAFEKYTVSPENFDLIFMDVQMPEMDGLEATGAIREWEERVKLSRPSNRWQPVTIVAMTAHAMKGDREKCLAAGMNDYIAKPIKREIVFKVIEKWIFNKEAL
jgi:FOG: CheY-like receiver